MWRSNKDMYVLTKDYKVIQPWELGGIDYIKYAPTIEELCDAFYVDTNYCYADDYDLLATKLWRLPTLDTMVQETKKQLYKDFPSIEDVYKYLSQKVKYTLYGMVKTDKGLIYIAKMNENNELELL